MNLENNYIFSLSYFQTDNQPRIFSYKFLHCFPEKSIRRVNVKSRTRHTQ